MHQMHKPELWNQSLECIFNAEPKYGNGKFFTSCMHSTFRGVTSSFIVIDCQTNTESKTCNTTVMIICKKKLNDHLGSDRSCIMRPNYMYMEAKISRLINKRSQGQILDGKKKCVSQMWCASFFLLHYFCNNK